MQIFGLESVSKVKQDLTTRLLNDIDCDLSSLTLIFDQNILSKEQQPKSPPFNKSIPLYVEINKELNYNLLPEHLKLLVEQTALKHLIWLPVTSLDKSDSKFVHDLSHELRHHYQRMKNINFFDVDLFLRNNTSLWISPHSTNRNYIEIPSESDCEIYARNCIKTHLGESGWREFRVEESKNWKSLDAYDLYIQRLDALESSRTNDPYQDSLEIINNHRMNLLPNFNPKWIINYS